MSDSCNVKPSKVVLVFWVGRSSCHLTGWSLMDQAA